jgi:hypothetical protein
LLAPRERLLSKLRKPGVSQLGCKSFTIEQPDADVRPALWIFQYFLNCCKEQIGCSAWRRTVFLNYTLTLQKGKRLPFRRESLRDTDLEMTFNKNTIGMLYWAYLRNCPIVWPFKQPPG